MENNLNITARIEALLFFKGEPVSAKFLADTLKVSETEIADGLNKLEEILKTGGRGVALMRNGDEIMLGTVAEMGATIENLLKEELTKDLGKAGLETLAIVLYRGPITRSEINYIRGVNSNYILRSLLVRGLIEKVEETHVRSTIYRPTFELLSYMGVSKVEDLPEYEGVKTAVEEFKNVSKEDSDEYEEEPDLPANKDA
ncbi:MAG: SMC-Scp complex subunit ScpB [Candidatus Pacebacteria bacterium]|nr:SMC-Scp complex subunit ScpB [Candidatus Paceibacterota bacterium]